MVWFLDTNIIVLCLRGKSPATMNHVQAVSAADVRIPLQVYAELLVGAHKSDRPEESEKRVRAFLAPFQVVSPDLKVAEHYADIRACLEASGTPISEADLWIAATARSAGGAVVTNNTREFSRVAGLSIEDWSS